MRNVVDCSDYCGIKTFGLYKGLRKQTYGTKKLTFKLGKRHKRPILKGTGYRDDIYKRVLKKRYIRNV